MSGRRGRGGGGGGGGHGGGGEERWLLPYSDMITLLLGLFIVLFAMSSIDAKQFDNVRRSLSQTFNGEVLEEPGSVLPGSNGIMDPTAASDTESQEVLEVENASRTSAAQFDREQKQLNQIAKQLNLGNDVKVVRNERGIAVRLAGDALFASGSWEIRPEMRDKLVAIEKELARFGHPIEIGGHTDGQPYAGDWGNMGLSTSRANAVWKLFDQRGYQHDLMTVRGYADTKPLKRPTKPNQDIAANRRIEITILEPGAEDGFPNDAATAPAKATATKSAAPARTTGRSGEVDSMLSSEFGDDPLVSELADIGAATR